MIHLLWFKHKPAEVPYCHISGSVHQKSTTFLLPTKNVFQHVSQLETVTINTVSLTVTHYQSSVNDGIQRFGFDVGEV